jgi:hypothetical protein
VTTDSRRNESAAVARMWRSTAEVGVPLLSLIGLALFVLVRLYYSQFFGTLGIDPDAVGLGYSATLVSAVGLLVAVAFAAIVYPTLVIVCVLMIVRLVRRAPVRPVVAVVLRPLIPRLRWMLPLISVLVLAALALLLLVKARHYADAVRAGKPVKFGVLAVTSFKVRATPAHLGVIGPPQDQPALVSLERRAEQMPPLLYLGQADGTAVFYDSRVEAALYVPTAAIVMRLTNCEPAHSRDRACRRAIE